MQLHTKEANISTSLQTFLDAPRDAYGAVGFGRTVYESGLSAIVYADAKTKVAPLYAMSVPRLELMGAVLGLNLTGEISKA